MKACTIEYDGATVAYLCFGRGTKIALCFHGYGETAKSFGFLESCYTGDVFTFLAIDLPFHGQTRWEEGKTFTKTDLQSLITGILAKENIDSDTPLTVVGYSLGGRIALQLYNDIPQRIERVVLLAPDGLKINIWYWFVTQTFIGNKVFYFTMKHPYWLFGLLKLANRFGLINVSIFKFVHLYIDDKTVRDDLYNRWTTLRKIKPALGQVKSFIRENNTPFRLLYGRFDKIILSSRGRLFQKGIENCCTIQIIDCGHQLLREKYTGEIEGALLH